MIPEAWKRVDIEHVTRTCRVSYDMSWSGLERIESSNYEETTILFLLQIKAQSMRVVQYFQVGLYSHPTKQGIF